MSAHLPLLGMLTYQPRHARPTVRWWPLLALLLAPPAITAADTPIGMVTVSVAAALVGGAVAVRWRLLRTGARIEEIIETELAPHDDPATSANAGDG